MSAMSEFFIEPKIIQGVKTFLYSQFFCTPPYPTHSFANQTIIVTGSNIGLGLEAARHFYRLDCAKLILAVRTISKGQLAKEDIIQSVPHRSDAEVIEVWPLDLSSTESTLAFAERFKGELTRVDVVVENAGVHNKIWTMADGVEMTIQVNVLNTFLLALSILPKLAETKGEYPHSEPHLVVVSSEAHRLAKFKEVSEANIYDALNEESLSFDGQDSVSKLLEVLSVRELVSRLSASTSHLKAAYPPVTINLVNPGLCKTTLDRSEVQTPLLMRAIRWVLDRTTEQGARTLVLGACAGQASHGEFMSDGRVQEVEGWILGDLGKNVQRKVWDRTMAVLEERRPGILKEAGLAS